MQNFDACNSFDELECENFVLLIDSIHESICEGQVQFDVGIYECVDSYFNSERDEESVSSFYMHYEKEYSYFLLANELIEDVNMFSEANETSNLSLPQEVVNENKVYDRAKKFH